MVFVNFLANMMIFVKTSINVESYFHEELIGKGRNLSFIEKAAP